MTGLRQKKKEKVRKNILTVAAKVFYAQGYEQATIAEIAREANIGVGTFYNYFPSKAHLFCESVLFVREDSWDEEFAKIQEKQFNNATDIILELIFYVLESIRVIRKPLLREFLLGVGIMYIHKGDELGTFLNTFLKRRYQAIDICKEQGLLPASLDSKETLTCIFSIGIVQLVTYAVDDDMTIEQLQQSLRRKISLFFQGKTSMSKEG